MHCYFVLQISSLCQISFRTKEYKPLLKKAVFVSGRDASSVARLSSVLQRCGHPKVDPADVHLVRDPVLSDTRLNDTDGVCWTQSEGEQ